MKKLLLAAAAFALLTAGCTKDKDNGASEAPIVFRASFEQPRIVMGESSQNYVWTEGDRVGVFVNTTREMLFQSGQAAADTRLDPLMADIPAYYGSAAYAYAPATGTADVFFRTLLQVPATQQFSGGHNPNVLNMASAAQVENGVADFRFRQLGAILELGLKSPDADIVLAKMKVELVNPSAGKYLTGQAKIDFTGAEPQLAPTVTNGLSSVTVEFPGGLALARTPAFVPVGVLPFSSDGGGMRVTVYDTENNACVLPAIWTGDNEISENGALTVGRGERVIDVLDDVLYQNFNRPEPVAIRVTDNRDGTPGANLKLELYAVEGNQLTKLNTLTTDASGTAVAALNPGVYRTYCAYDAQTDAKWNQLDFTVVSRGENEFDFVIYPIVFADDFDWIMPEMGGSVVLKELYESINPPVANTTNEVVWTAGVGVSELLAARGWTFSAQVFIRPGSARVGKKSATGTITTPRLGVLTSPTVKVTLVAMPWHVVTNNAWKLEEAELVFKITGGGSFAQGETVTSHTTDPMTSDAPATPLRKNTFELTVYGATSETQISVTNKLPDGISSSLYRVMIDQVKIAEVR